MPEVARRYIGQCFYSACANPGCSARWFESVHAWAKLLQSGTFPSYVTQQNSDTVYIFRYRKSFQTSGKLHLAAARSRCWAYPRSPLLRRSPIAIYSCSKMPGQDGLLASASNRIAVWSPWICWCRTRNRAAPRPTELNRWLGPPTRSTGVARGTLTAWR